MHATFRRFLIAQGYKIVFFLQVRNEVENATDSGVLLSENDIEEISGDRSILSMCD